MDDLEAQGDSEEHPRVIIHVDMDYFYAQVEEVLDPSLKNKPVGVKQRFNVVTSNYIAREYGIKKMTLIAEAKKLCPDLVLVNGEDLTKYKQMSGRINEIMHKFTPNVEKLGLDENFLDVTKEINEKLEQGVCPEETQRVEGFIHPPVENTDLSDREAFQKSCGCGCDRRLILATHMAQEIRDCIFRELGLKCCAGIAHNKLLAKLVGGVHKQNKQTVLLPDCASSFMRSLGSVKSITGIGEKTAQILEECDIKTVNDLQAVPLEQLVKRLGQEQASRLKEISFGKDYTPVKATGKPKSVGLEDSCPAISIRADAEEKFRHLLVRLVKNIADDGRIPIAIKVTVRKHDSAKKTSHRECKQDKILPSNFRHKDGKLVLTEGAQDRILGIVMKLFERMVDLQQPFNITLLGLSFFKFQERKVGTKSIANFLIKKSDIEVQSITNLSNESLTLSDSFTSNKSFSIPMDCDPSSGAGMSDSASLASHSGSESDAEPSPKKSRRLATFLVRKNSSLMMATEEDSSSPSKLRVADLRLNSKEYDQETCNVTLSDIPSSSKSAGFFKNHLSSSTPAKPSTVSTVSVNSSPTCTDNNIPSSVDPEVFNALPADVQQELLQNWRKGSPIASSSSTPTATNPSSTSKNTLHRYFLKNT
ncbi:DNA polymerase iota [Toxorhynchites rutilus septentrionalis]|uniref:DNA polymerase iota n=1 Tax=Toxorhynchites rutilus septentrionalis TaxID=329112 RepID=UPI002478B097|nr:DNA polymerase iota [Toxorhynchites rutilus septentrionalis]XP_055639236.1 DNA polymerase iota [Toxorhynchites rutilus septentrionalis]XP_055639245.1 DNA polymerase iota [Toxorhynchites rutilus septentrionalis]XP_055639255.1 DNA polymerase iota [Toxorhynchites rutilus septentrionalis]